MTRHNHHRHRSRSTSVDQSKDPSSSHPHHTTGTPNASYATPSRSRTRSRHDHRSSSKTVAASNDYLDHHSVRHTAHRRGQQDVYAQPTPSTSRWPASAQYQYPPGPSQSTNQATSENHHHEQLQPPRFEAISDDDSDTPCCTSFSSRGRRRRSSSVDRFDTPLGGGPGQSNKDVGMIVSWWHSFKDRISRIIGR